MTDEEIIAKGFKPWHGGDTAPADYEDSPRKGSAVLMRDGTISRIGGSCFWKNSGSPGNIIGYHPKEPTKPTRIVIPDGPAPEWTKKRWFELIEQGRWSSATVTRHLIAMLEQPPVDPVESALNEILDRHNYTSDGVRNAIREALERDIEMGKGEV